MAAFEAAQRCAVKSPWDPLNPKDKKCHLVRMTEVAAAKQIAVANPTP